jgi:hypothetical protein
MFFLYPVGYNPGIREIFDDYTAEGFIDSSIDSLAHLIQYLAVLISILSVFIVFYVFVIAEEGEK